MLTAADITELRQQYGTLVRSVISRFFKCPEDRDDCEQDVWLSISTRDVLMADIQQGWVSVAAKYVCLDWLEYGRPRNAGRFEIPEQDDHTDLQIDLEALGDRSGEIEDSRVAVIREAVKVLPDDLRELVIRRFYRNETVEYIASGTGLSVCLIHLRLREAMEKIAFSLPSQPQPDRSPNKQSTNYSPLRPSVHKPRAEDGIRLTAGNASQTVYRERLSGGRWIYQHRELNPVDERAYWEILFEERQELYGYPLSRSAESAPTSITSRLKKPSLPDVVEMLRQNLGTSKAAIQERFGFSPSYAEKILYRARKELGLVGKPGCRRRAA